MAPDMNVRQPPATKACNGCHALTCPLPSSRRNTAGRGREASYAEDLHGQVHEGLKRDRRAVHPKAQPTEVLEPAEGVFDYVALSLERGIFVVQLTQCLLGRDTTR
jgi:hypothetical protein